MIQDIKCYSPWKHINISFSVVIKLLKLQWLSLSWFCIPLNTYLEVYFSINASDDLICHIQWKLTCSSPRKIKIMSGSQEGDLRTTGILGVVFHLFVLKNRHHATQENRVCNMISLQQWLCLSIWHPHASLWQSCASQKHYLLRKITRILKVTRLILKKIHVSAKLFFLLHFFFGKAGMSKSFS